MTNEQAKSELMQIYMSLSEEKKMALDVLMAQADGEYISRTELLKAIDTWDKFGVDDTNSLFRLDNLSLPHYVPYIHYDDVVNCIKGMPSVAIPSAEPKTGNWEEVGEEYIQVYDLNGIPSCGDERICSECGFETVFIGEHCSQYKFCPNCGAKMVEPQEISDHNLKMWHDIYAEEKRREGSNKE